MRTLKSPGEIDDLFRSGRRGSTELIMVLCTKTPEQRGPEGRVVFVAGKKLGGAVMRNRCKRVLRAATARVGGPWAGYDVAIVARRDTATAAPADLDEALLKAVGKSGIQL
jgi:ribonuclease P protein component